MDSMRDICNRMVSVQKTMKITNAMYLMASSKLKKARVKLAAVEPYFDKLQYVISDILDHTEEGRQRYFATDRVIPPEEIKAGYLIITSDKGLAGSYNLNVCRLAEAHLKQTHNNKLYFIGLSGRNYFLKHPELGTIVQEHSYTAVNPDLWLARRIAEDAMRDFLNGDLDELFVVYTKMKNALVSEAQVQQVLPLTRKMFPVSQSHEDEETGFTYHTEYTPSALEVLDRVVPNYTKGLIYGTMVEAFTSEQNASMTAMKNATDSAGEIVQALSLEYNQVRQSAITTEINEVVAGANAQEQ
ncbi:MAG: ATP synthase F1 subunit gamma [Oscillospiraceae bacterium]|nr:ATP synthase F1 subunit gamma [Oscillospiraceae bacterium]